MVNPPHETLLCVRFKNWIVLVESTNRKKGFGRKVLPNYERKLECFFCASYSRLCCDFVRLNKRHVDTVLCNSMDLVQLSKPSILQEYKVTFDLASAAKKSNVAKILYL